MCVFFFVQCVCCLCCDYIIIIIVIILSNVKKTPGVLKEGGVTAVTQLNKLLHVLPQA